MEDQQCITGIAQSISSSYGHKDNSSIVKMEESQVKSEVATDEDDAFMREWVEPVDCKEDQKWNIAITDAKDEETFESCSDGEVNCSNTSEFNDRNGKLTMKPKGNAMISCRKKTRKKIDSVVAKLCQDAVISEEFASKCAFKCPSCGKCFNVWQTMVTHSRKCARTIYIKDVEECIVKIVCHVCRICSEKVLCDGDFMKRHLVLQHKTTLGSYIHNFALDPLKKIARMCLQQ